MKKTIIRSSLGTVLPAVSQNSAIELLRSLRHKTELLPEADRPYSLFEALLSGVSPGTQTSMPQFIPSSYERRCSQGSRNRLCLVQLSNPTTSYHRPWSTYMMHSDFAINVTQTLHLDHEGTHTLNSPLVGPQSPKIHQTIQNPHLVAAKNETK